MFAKEVRSVNDPVADAVSNLEEISAGAGVAHRQDVKVVLAP